MRTWPILIGIFIILVIVCSPAIAISKSDLISHYKTDQSVRPTIPIPTPAPTPIPTTVPTTIPTQSPSDIGWIITTVDSAGDVWGPTSLALDTAGNPHISYFTHNPYSFLKYAEWMESSGWITSIVDSGGMYGLSISLVLDQSGNPHIGYLEDSAPPGDPSHGHLDLKYAKWTGSVWQTEIVDSAGSVRLSMALDAAGNPSISYFTGEPSYDLKYARWTGTAWQTETVDPDCGSNVDGSVSLALDTAGNPHISYYTGDPYYDLKYAEWTKSSGWITSFVDSSGNVNVAGDTSLALDEAGNPHISYNVVGASQDGGYSSYDLRYARWTGGVWLTETVDSAGIWFATSIALDEVGNPHISYFTGQPDYDLKYARKTGSLWQTETVDAAGIVGLYNSLALDAARNPHISYVDYGELCPFTVNQDSEDPHYDLKYAYYGRSSWIVPTSFPTKTPTKVPTVSPTQIPSEWPFPTVPNSYMKSKSDILRELTGFDLKSADPYLIIPGYV